MGSRGAPGVEFDDFVARVEGRLRQGLVATYGLRDGREAAVDALSWAWEHWDEVRVMTRPVGYLYRVGQSAVRRFAPRPIPIDEAPPEPPLGSESEVPRVLGQLPDQQRTVVVLVHAFGWRQQDVAELLGVSASTVHAHLDRGVRRLRELLEVPDAC